MKLVLYGFGRDKMVLDLDYLARTYGIEVLEKATVVYENSDEFFASLEEGEDEQALEQACQQSQRRVSIRRKLS